MWNKNVDREDMTAHKDLILSGRQTPCKSAVARFNSTPLKKATHQ